MPKLNICEIITIILMYHQSPCKNFEYYYKSYLQLYVVDFGDRSPSYNRFVELKPRALVYLELFLKWCCIQSSNKTKIAYIDSTSLGRMPE